MVKYKKHIKLILESANEVSKRKSLLPKAFIAPDVLLKMLQGEERAKELLSKSEGKMELITSDFALYEDVSCLTKDEFDLNVLKDLLYRVEIIPSPKIKIDLERIDHLRGCNDREK